MKYEMLYLIDSSIAEEARDALIAKFEELVKTLGGKVVSTDKWGVKKLAYPINYKSDAFYVLMHGEVSLGGGFQAGALLAMAFMLYIMFADLGKNKFRITQHFSVCVAACGVFIYFLTGFLCMINGGSAYNIIPGTVTITGSTRTFSKETRDKLPETIRRISESIAAAHGGSIEFSFSYGYASVMNDKALTANSRKLIEEAFGKDAVLDIDPLMPGEDFSALEKDCPGFFVELGAGSNGCTFPHHNSRYLMDEDALGYGIEYLVRLVRNRLS